MIWLTTGPFPPAHATKPPSSTRTAEAGDILVTEYHSNYNGYISGIEHSISIGKPHEEFIKIHQVCLEAQRRGIDAMLPGAFLADVVMAFRKPIEDAGMNLAWIEEPVYRGRVLDDLNSNVFKSFRDAGIEIPGVAPVSVISEFS